MNRVSKRRLVACVVGLLMVPALSSCGPVAAADLEIECLPDVSPTLPNVPTIPPPPYPVQLPDSSYTVFGLRRRLPVTMDTDVEVTGYIVEIYVPPACPDPEHQACPTPSAPHMWIADARGETDHANRLMVVGYADNDEAIQEAMENARRGREQAPESETGVIPIPTDFFVNNKVKVRGHFARIAGSGFNVSEGLLEYRGHSTLELSPEAEAAQPRR